eukprot:CAMPEP_0173289902 /NCGR_PEP_ID=MMETSP1143-20121109/11268_1 /TAXON_ID=483371 /ORGANISM="non described non described, Strain CCMP2298" /LENGTH=225 /DNA_ID=CAMNT_0014228905 /DNA_START=22 /DNA_END=695 /DNA_ORIENTATION=+
MAELADQEERIEWLRGRGVEIEIPAERRKVTEIKDKRYVKIVKIPADESKPYTECTIPVEAGRAGDQLPSILRIFFNQGGVKLADVQTAASKQFANQELNVSQKTIDKMGQEGSVEAFPLAHPSARNDNCRVCLYLDEVGQLKGLPPNPRAAKLASLCGFKDVPLVGDMFIGRVGPHILPAPATTATATAPAAATATVTDTTAAGATGGDSKGTGGSGGSGGSGG